ncbi:DUF4870 domain-containing protein [uncultured Akkermansia sp.]|uniref:DUF4870 domain-containing protein n=1 Tax=uncultured Akkermansia sp. TaxID=512294 RepID=UPI002639EB0D|nr:DUF4870 domain-containing protein [uncultured Akkermansia sp.]
MDEEQQMIQEPVQEPAPEKQSDKTQAILTAVSPLVSVFFGGSAGVNIIPPLICWLVWRDANPLVDKVGKNILNAQISWAIYTVAACLSCLILIGFVLAPRGGHRLDRFLHHRCRQGGERGLRLCASLHD